MKIWLTVIGTRFCPSAGDAEVPISLEERYFSWRDTRVDLLEHQARDVFARHGVPVLPGILARTPAEARAAADKLGTPVLVVKAQVKVGGRGKAGGVKVVRTPAEAEEAARAILGMDIKGHTVHSVLVAEGADIAEEYYFSILLDRSSHGLTALCSKEGGVEIEQLAKERPEALARVEIDPLEGLTAEASRDLLEAAGFDAEQIGAIAPVLERLWEVYRDEDATLVEVNPLVTTTGGEILALDGKVSIDDNSLFRHDDLAALASTDSKDPLEEEAQRLGLNYVKLDGEVGVVGNGAGLVMSSLDVVAYAGRDFGGIHPANFLDIGGGASASVMADGLGLVLADPQVKSVFINVFGGITACDQVALGIVSALEKIGDRAAKPIVVRLDGNAVEEGREVLRRAKHPLVHIADSMDDAARQAAALAAGK